MLKNIEVKRIKYNKDSRKWDRMWDVCEFPRHVLIEK